MFREIVMNASLKMGGRLVGVLVLASAILMATCFWLIAVALDHWEGYSWSAGAIWPMR